MPHSLVSGCRLAMAMGRHKRVALLCGLLGWASASIAADSSGVSMQYYDIDGKSATHLRNEMNRQGPLDASGKRFDARTDWRLKWNYWYEPTRDGCRFTRFNVGNTSQIIMPRWRNAQSASPKLAAQWKRYYEALHAHEMQHHAHGLQAEQAIRQLGTGFRSASGCAKIGDEFNRQAERILEHYRQADREFDKRTAHGMNRGARFP